MHRVRTESEALRNACERKIFYLFRGTEPKFLVHPDRYASDRHYVLDGVRLALKLTAFRGYALYVEDEDDEDDIDFLLTV